MSGRFEGLNLPQLLDLMHELAVPEPVPWLPQTPGWWVFCGWALAVTALLIAASGVIVLILAGLYAAWW